MKPLVKNTHLQQLLILVVMFLISLETVFAQDNVENVPGTAQIKIRDNPTSSMPRMNDSNPRVEKKDADLLNELIQPEPVNKTEQTVKKEACSSVKCTPDTPQ